MHVLKGIKERKEERKEITPTKCLPERKPVKAQRPVDPCIGCIPPGGWVLGREVNDTVAHYVRVYVYRRWKIKGALSEHASLVGCNPPVSILSVCADGLARVGKVKFM
jgi:hypothetical protein